MEFSVAKKIQNLKHSLYRTHFPHLTSTPAHECILPGLGHTIKRVKYIVGVPGHQKPDHLIQQTEKSGSLHYVLMR